MSSPSDRRLPGGCDCGTVGYFVEDAFDHAPVFHCGNSPRTTGSAFKPFAMIRRDGLAVARGDDQTNATQCATSISLPWSVVNQGQWVHMAMGAASDAPLIRSMPSIFASRKAPWHRTTDDLPQYREFWT